MIRRINVENLWGERSVDWTLSRQVNILSGTNGTGKSTILRSVYRLMTEGSLPRQFLSLFDSLTVELDDGSVYSSDSPFDPNTVVGEAFSNLYRLEEYNQAEVLSFTSDGIFCDMIDKYLSLTRKTIVRNSDTLNFRLKSGMLIPPELLSTGDKELLKILAMASLATEKDVIILDEPENSLHFDWQKTLLNSILEASPKVQILVSTHSPAIIMNGWLANVDNIDKLTKVF